MRRDDLTLALLELRQTSARERRLESQVRLARRAARRERRGRARPW